MNHTLRLILIAASILLISWIDYLTGTELSFSIFYLIPLSVLALQPGVSRETTIIFSFLAALLWFGVEMQTHQYSLVFYPIWNGAVRFLIFLGFALLLHSYREKEESLLVSNEELRKLNEEKNRFVGIAAHDLRSPLNGITGLSDILLNHNKDALPADQRRMLGMIKELSDNMLVLIKNLLDVSQIESGKIIMNMKEQNYVAYLEKHIALQRIIARKKNIRVTFEHPGDIVPAYFDEHHLSEVINNLLSNAIKYSPPDSQIQVRLTTRGNMLLTEVIDHGEGIREEEQEKLFNYFQKASSKTTAGEPSTGLGLAIARKIVAEHKGRIGVRSSFKEGSTFYYELPVKMEQANGADGVGV